MTTVRMAFIVFVLGVAGCKDAGVTPLPPENLLLSLKAPETVLGKVNHEVLHITSVGVIMKEIEFSRAGSEDSVEIESGPLVLSLSLDARISLLAAVKIPPGVFDGLRFTIYRPADKEPVTDSAFAGAGGDRFSIVIRGFYHETPFTLRSPQLTRLNLTLATPASVVEDRVTNVTFRIDPYLWFETGGLILDPFHQTAEIEDHIRSSFAEVFRDNDRDGNPD